MSTATPSDYALLRRYLGHDNQDSYRVDLHTFAMVKNSYQRAVTYAEAMAALDRLEAKHGNS